MPKLTVIPFAFSPFSTQSTKDAKRNISCCTTLSEAALEEAALYTRSFAPVPVILTPSRIPSNGFITSCRALFFNTPMLLDHASGWANGRMIEWYDWHRSKGSTLVEKLQLRRDRRPPYYHEYIVVFTLGGYVYRIDRRPDVDTPFDTIMKKGNKPCDTVESVSPRSLELLEEASDCTVELHWQGEQKIDLLFILSVCLAVTQDEQAKHYTLQRYNCVFLSWTIVMIAVRHTTAWETRLDAAISSVFKRREQAKKFWRRALAQSVALAVNRSIELAKVEKGERAMMWIRAGRMHQDHVRQEVEKSLVEVVRLDLALSITMGVGNDWERALGSLECALKQERRLERKLRRILELVHLEKVTETFLIIGDERDENNGRELAWTQAEAALREALGKDLWWDSNMSEDNPGRRLNVEMILEEMQKSMRRCAYLVSRLLFARELDDWQSTVLRNMRKLPSTIRSKPQPNGIPPLQELIVGAAEALVRSTLSPLVVLPTRLAVSVTNNNGSNTKQSKPASSENSHEGLEHCLMKVIAVHAKRVARWGLAPAEGVERDMLDGMKRVWTFVSRHPVHV